MSTSHYYIAIAIIIAALLLWDWVREGREYIDRLVVLTALLLGAFWPVTIWPLLYWIVERHERRRGK